MKEYLLLALAVWNGITVGLYGMDKWLAIKKHRRISERTLLAAALAAGGVGAVFGMLWFSHKTGKWYFKLAATVGTLGVALVVAFLHTL